MGVYIIYKYIYVCNRYIALDTSLSSRIEWYRPLVQPVALAIQTSRTGPPHSIVLFLPVVSRSNVTAATLFFCFSQVFYISFHCRNSICLRKKKPYTSEMLLHWRKDVSLYSRLRQVHCFFKSSRQFFVRLISLRAAHARLERSARTLSMFH